MGKVILYEHGCPNCIRLKRMLDNKHIQYEDFTDKNAMIEMGFKSAPKLEVDGVLMDFLDAKKWVEEQ
jgi:glutaredoxin